MKYVILSANSNIAYSRQIPIVCHLWKNLISYQPIVYFIDEIEDFVVENTKKVGAQYKFFKKGFANINNTVRLSQNIRLFAVLIEKQLKEDDYLIISDADMYPLSYQHFNTAINWNKKLHILNAKGMAPDEVEYPMCYLGADVKTWKEILNEKNFFDIGEKRDQPFITELIKGWPGYEKETQKFIRKTDPKYGKIFNMRYVNRIDRINWRDYQPGDIDSHIFRDNKLKSWEKMEKLVQQVGVYDDWCQEYFSLVKNKL